MSLSSFSQNTYPKIIVLNGDSLILLTHPQLKATNSVFSKYEITLSKSVLMRKRLDDIMDLSFKKNKVIFDLSKQVDSYQKISEDLLNKNIDNKNEINDLQFKLKRSRAMTKKATIIGGIIGAMVVLLLK